MDQKTSTTRLFYLSGLRVKILHQPHIHKFLRFQIEEHKTGDPMEIR
jgi:hypothetical protein